jgi:hypothetical protein
MVDQRGIFDTLVCMFGTGLNLALRLLMAVLVVWTPCSASGVSVLEPKTAHDMSVEFSSPFPALTDYGFFPLTVKITNKTRRDSTHTARFVSEGREFSNQSPTQMSSVFFFKTRSGSQTISQLSVPLCTSLAPYPSLSSNVSGNGIRVGEGSGGLMSQFSSSGVSKYTLMSLSLHTRSWLPISNKVNPSSPSGGNLSGGWFNHTAAPEDWRNYIAVSAVWLTVSEFNMLNSAQRRALLRGVGHGMRLQLFDESDNHTVMLPPEALQTGAKKWIYGCGEIFLHKWDGVAVDADAGAALWKGQVERKTSAFVEQGANSSWDLAKEVRTIRLNLWFFTLFILAFAIIIGPVNLFYFAPEGRRARLFWTTPLISLLASIALAVFVLVSDGTGGSGVRHVTVLSMPSDNSALILQDQACRTGVLLSQRFETSADIWLTPLNCPKFRTYRHGRLERTGKVFSGEWFSSRTLQGHFASEYRALRERVELVTTRSVTGPEFKARDVPVMMSTFSVPLDFLIYIDPKGRRWHALNVVPGRVTELKPGEADGLDDTLYARRPDYVRQLLLEVRGLPGWYYAYSSQADALAIPTHSDIKWKKTTACLLGPVARK